MIRRPLDDYDLIETITAEPLSLTLHWKNGRIIEMRTRWAKSVTESAELSEDAFRLRKALARYVDGQAPNWPDLPLDFSHLTEFHAAVLNALYRIPSGKVCTYGELASIVGNPKGARAIGRAMATNPFPIVYPCHRVIGANGKMTGFSAEDGINLKKFLLTHEGAL